MESKIKNLIFNQIIASCFFKGINILFPKVCLICQKEEDYLCSDCQGLLEISGFHKNRSILNLSNLYFAFNYKNLFVKKIIQSFKYEPFVKDLGKLLSSLIIAHFQLMDNKPDFCLKIESNKKNREFVIVPVPLHKKRLKWRGFNQAEILAKELAVFFDLPLALNCLIKTKTTCLQAGLPPKERKENIEGAFAVKSVKKEAGLFGKTKKDLIKGKNILLVDDIYTTGSTMQECAKVLKMAGAKKVIGIVFARG